MANIITKDKSTREAVDRHMMNSVEYSNPNLRKDIKAKFPTPNQADEQRVVNMKDLERLLKEHSTVTRVVFGGWRVDEYFKGFFTYSPAGLLFDKNEVRVEFSNGSECLNKLNQVVNDYPRHI